MAMDFSLDATPTVRQFINAAASAPVDTRHKRVLRVSIEGVKAPKSHSAILRVFVNCEKLTKGTPISDASYVGSYAFFEGNHKRGGHETVNFVMNATPAFLKLYGGRPFANNEPLKVSVVVSPRPGQSGDINIQQIDPRQVHFELVQKED
jgi:hypothetical protein